MKLYPPEPQIDLYREGFQSKDLLNRQPTSKSLSSLVERFEDPLVIVLDGPWGSGKSYFLRRWVGAHTLENEGSATTVYFDAFANDFLDDPLTGLVAAINERIPAGKDRKALKKLKGAAAQLARPALRVALAAATAGITELTGNVLDAAAATGSNDIENAIDQFWKREDGKREAMKQVEESLIKITSRAEGEAPKLVIVIDELDRCRPDYALAVLETIKHFFAVPNVHFVLGVNFDALKHSVEARYGHNIDAESYLRRFVSLTLRFRQPNPSTERRPERQIYLSHQAKVMGLPKEIVEALEIQIGLNGKVGASSIRDMNRVLMHAALMEDINRFSQLPFGIRTLLISLLLLKVLDQKLYEKASNRQIHLSDIKEFYGISIREIDPNPASRGSYNHSAASLNALWEFLLSDDNVQHDESISRSFGMFRCTPSEIDFRDLTSRNFDYLHLNELG